MDLITTAEDLLPILGLLPPLRRGPPHHHQQIQYLPPVCPCWHYYRGADHPHGPWSFIDHYAVSSP